MDNKDVSLWHAIKCMGMASVKALLLVSAAYIVSGITEPGEEFSIVMSIVTVAIYLFDV